MLECTERTVLGLVPMPFIAAALWVCTRKSSKVSADSLCSSRSDAPIRGASADITSTALARTVMVS